MKILFLGTFSILLCAQDLDQDSPSDCNLSGVNLITLAKWDIPPLGTGPDFVLISAGTDPLGRYVITRDFYMMTTPVTEGMWDSVILNSILQSNFPKELTWYEAIEFANELSNWQIWNSAMQIQTRMMDTILMI